MAQINARANYTVYDYSAYDTTKVPLEGESRYFDTIETWIKNICHVVGDGSSQVDELPFVEVMRIETAVNISLEDYRITGNKAEIHNTDTSIITFDIGTTGTPNAINLNPGESVIYRFNGSNWIKIIDSETVEISGNTTLDGTDPYKEYIISGIVEITLDELANSKYKRYRFLLEDDGYCSIVPDGVETINGLSELKLFTEGQFIEIIWTSSEWKIMNHNISIKGGLINNSDWTARHLGWVDVDYDIKSGTFIIGEYVEEEISGNRGKIIQDTGSTLTLVYITSGGVFTDNRELTGDESGATCDVDEAGTGSTKDLDSYLFHGLGLNINQIKTRLVISSDGTYNNSFESKDISFENGVNDTDGNCIFQVDTDNIKIQTASSGVLFVGDTSNAVRLGAATDYYYEPILEFDFT